MLLQRHSTLLRLCDQFIFSEHYQAGDIVVYLYNTSRNEIIDYFLRARGVPAPPPPPGAGRPLPPLPGRGIAGTEPRQKVRERLGEILREIEGELEKVREKKGKTKGCNEEIA